MEDPLEHKERIRLEALSLAIQTPIPCSNESTTIEKAEHHIVERARKFEVYVRTGALPEMPEDLGIVKPIRS